jgi:hypothetical protein
MKKFVAVLLTTGLLSALVPAVEGAEPERENALMRFADRQDMARPSKNQSMRGNDAAAIAKLIDDINAAVRRNKQRMLSIITINTDVAGSTLEKQKAQTGLTFGDLYVAHSLALSTRKKFDAIMALKKGGQSWSQIAKAHNVRLGGSKALLDEMKKK